MKVDIDIFALIKRMIAMIYSNKDFESLGFLYQAEDLPKNILIEDFCTKHRVDYPTSDTWYRKTHKKVCPVIVNGMPANEEEGIMVEVEKVSEESKVHDPVRHINLNGRDIQLDILKGLGILFVVFAHTCTNWLSEFIYLFHMPLFFFLSGAAMSYSNDKYLICKRAYRFMIPYLFFSLISFLYWFYVESRFRPVHDGSIFKILTGRLDMGWQQFLNIFLAFSYHDAFLYNVVMWFLPCLFMVTMIFIFIRKNLRRYEILGVIFVAMLGIILSDICLPMCLEISFVALPFLWCGNFIYKHLRCTSIVMGGG